MSLTTADLIAAAADMAYKPGWRLLVREIDPHQGPYLSILVDLPDASNPSTVVPLRIHSPIPPQHSLGDFYEWVTWRLCRVEIHEALEWFKVDGSPWRNPHKGLD